VNSQRIFITGASSGIGEHLAYAYARRGAILGLAARRIDRLNEVAETCREAGGKTFTYELDVRDEEAAKRVTHQFLKDAGGIDIVIANAGIGGKDQLGSGDPAHINRILSTNILGVTNIVVPFIPTMKNNRSGNIVIISSVAGFRGLIAHGGYSGSKAAVRIMAESWRFNLARFDIRVTTICPGFIDTPIVDNRSFLPFLMKADLAAEKIIRAINRGKKTYIFPWQWRIVVPILRIIPDWMIKTFTAR